MKGVNDAPSRETAVAHVVYVWPYIEWGGAQRYFISLMRRMVTRARVSVIMPAGSARELIEELEALGAGVVLMPGRLVVTPPASMAARVGDHARAWHAQYAMWQACRRVAEPGTVFHCDVSLTLFTPVLGALASRHGVVVSLHTSLPAVTGARAATWKRRLQWLTSRPGFRLVAANRHVRESLRPFLPADVVDRVPLAYSPVEGDEVRAATLGPAVRGPGRNDGRFLVVTGGQFIERKGCWVLLNAARRVRAKAPDVDFVWIGPSPVTGRAAAELAATDASIRYVAQAELPEGRLSYLKTVASSDAFVLPSLEEGLPLALVEAMALGVPVVSTPVNAIPEAVQHEVTGLMVTPGDAESLSDAILRLRHDPELARRLAEAGSAHARIFDADVMVDVTRGVYESCVRTANDRALRHARNTG